MCRDRSCSTVVIEERTGEEQMENERNGRRAEKGLKAR